MRLRSHFDEFALFSLTLMLLSLGCAAPMASMVDGKNVKSRVKIFSKSKDVLVEKQDSLQGDLPASRRKIDIKGQQVDPAFLDRLKESKAESGSETSQLGNVGHHFASKHHNQGANGASGKLGVIPEVKTEGVRTKGSRVAFKFSDSSLAQFIAPVTNDQKMEADSQRAEENMIRISVKADPADLSLASNELPAGSVSFQSVAIAPDSLKGPYPKKAGGSAGSSNPNSEVKASSARLQSKFHSTLPKKVVRALIRSPERISVKGYLTDQGNNIRAIVDTGANQTEIIAVGSRLAIGEKSKLEIFEVDAIDSVVHLRNTLTKQRLIIK